jgi:hypothetical protein
MTCEHIKMIYFCRVRNTGRTVLQSSRWDNICCQEQNHPCFKYFLSTIVFCLKYRYRYLLYILIIEGNNFSNQIDLLYTKWRFFCKSC